MISFAVDTLLALTPGVWSLLFFFSLGDPAMVWHGFLFCNIRQHDDDTPHGMAEERHPGSEATLAHDITPSTFPQHPQVRRPGISTCFTYILDLWV